MIKIWDFASGIAFENLTGHGDAVMEVKWSPDASMLASASDDRTVKLWTTTDWTNTMNLTDHTIGVLSVDWSKNASVLSTGSRDYSVMLWNVSTGESIAKWSSPNCVRSVDWHPEAELIASSGPAESMLRVRNSTSGSVLKTFEEVAESGSDVMSTRWSPDGKMLAGAAGKEHTIRVYAFGYATEPPVPLIPEWLPGTVIFFAVATVGTILMILQLKYKFKKERKEEGP
jgi:WD40 repeat protein